MACCVIAAFLLAQFVAMLRRWGVFWGLLPVPQGEVADTVFTRIAQWAARPRVRRALGAAVACEMMMLGGWLAIAHGEHIAEYADIGWSRLHGAHVIYAGLCDASGNRRIRVVLDPARDARLAFN